MDDLTSLLLGGVCLFIGVALIRLAIEVHRYRGDPERMHPRRFAMWTDLRTGQIVVRRTGD